MAKRTVPAAHFCATLEANLENKKMDDAAFRQLVRNSLPIVQYETVAEIRAKHA